MKRFLLLLLLLISLVNVFAQRVAVLPKPNPPRLVADNANLLSDYDRSTLEQKLDDLNNNTSNQIAVVTIPTLGDETILEDYANALFRSWGIGNKKHNNGVLVLIVANDHKIRIEVGYGLEGAIPDVTAKDIITNDLAPAFKLHDYYSGINAAVESLGKAATGEYNERGVPASHIGFMGLNPKELLTGILCIIIFSIGFFNRGKSSSGGFVTTSHEDYSTSSSSSASSFSGFGGGSSGGGGASGGW